MSILDVGIGLFVFGIIIYVLALLALHTKVSELRRLGINLEAYSLPAAVGLILIIIGLVSKFIG